MAFFSSIWKSLLICSCPSVHHLSLAPFSSSIHYSLLIRSSSLFRSSVRHPSLSSSIRHLSFIPGSLSLTLTLLFLSVTSLPSLSPSSLTLTLLSFINSKHRHIDEFRATPFSSSVCHSLLSLGPSSLVSPFFLR